MRGGREWPILYEGRRRPCTAENNIFLVFMWYIIINYIVKNYLFY